MFLYYDELYIFSQSQTLRPAFQSAAAFVLLSSVSCAPRGSPRRVFSVKEALGQHCCSLPRKDSTHLIPGNAPHSFYLMLEWFSVPDRRSGTRLSVGGCSRVHGSISIDVLDVRQQVVVCSMWAHFKNLNKGFSFEIIVPQIRPRDALIYQRSR